MPLISSFIEDAPEIATWRRELHRIPELEFDLPRTSAYVAERLRSFGVDSLTTGIGGTGLVACVEGRGPGRTLGLRADMDALPLREESGQPWASEHPGRMHGCGHDGHTAMLLGVARYLVATRAFSGRAVLVFQPAEEKGGGGAAMIADGLMQRWGIEEIYGLHNQPGMPIGHFATRPGPLLAAADHFSVTVRGRGGHAAAPHTAIDPVVTSAAMIQALQTIVARTLAPLDTAAVSVTCLSAGETDNIIADTARLAGTVRTLTPEVRKRVAETFARIVHGVAATFGATAEIAWTEGYPSTRNHPAQTAFAADVALEIAGDTARVNGTTDPILAAEDFAYMLEARPGAYMFIGNGSGPALHNAAYDFCDEAIPYGCSFLARLVERRSPLP